MESTSLTSMSPLSSPTSTSPSGPIRRKSRVTAEHTLTRVRENQRRHRARRRDYIHTLEVQLAETELQLEAARMEIEILRQELDLGRRQDLGREQMVEFGNIGSSGSKSVHGGANKNQTLDLLALGQEMDIGVEMALEMEYPASESRSTPASASVISTSPTTMTLPMLLDALHPPPSLALLPSGPPPCCTDTPSVAILTSSSSPPSLNLTPSAPIPPANPECTTCATRPPPSPNESTTLCSQAYMLISQQNFRQIDAGTIRLWLWQGYRRAMRRGEGCRVENGVLMGVLDLISGEL